MSTQKTVSTHSTPSLIEISLYYDLRVFYADHLVLREQGDAAAWFGTFDDNSTLMTNLFDQSPVMVKSTFIPKIRALDAEFEAAGIQLRHSASNFVFTCNGDNTVSARFYGVLFVISSDGISRVHSTSVVNDLLRREEPGWRILSRRLIRDDLA